MNRLQQLFDVFLGGLRNVVGIVLLAGVVLNFVNVCMRYLFGQPFAWTEEMMVFGLLFIVMAGVVIATAHDQHLKIDVLVQILPRIWQRLLRGFAHVVWILVSLYLAFQSFNVVMLMKRLGQTSLAMRLPSWIPHSFLLAAFTLSSLAAIIAILRYRPSEHDNDPDSSENGSIS